MKLPVCHIVCQNEKSSVEGHMTGGIWNDSDKEKDELCPTVWTGITGRISSCESDSIYWYYPGTGETGGK